MNTTEIPFWAGVVVFAALLFLLTIFIGYLNDYASCQRTQTTRHYAAQRNITATHFQRNLAQKVQQRSNEERRLVVLLREQPHKRPLDRMLVQYFSLRADEDRNDAAGYSRYADQLNRQVAPPINCSTFPPPT